MSHKINAIKGDNEKCIDGGMNAYLSKPFKEEDLLKIVSSWLGAGNVTVDAENTEAVTEVPEKLYDLSSIRTISRGNETFVIKMVNMFIDQTPAQVADMISMYHHSDYKAMGAMAHKIKPSIDNMGVVSLKETIREIEKIGKSGTDNGSLAGLLETVSTQLEKVFEALQKEFEVPVS